MIIKVLEGFLNLSMNNGRQSKYFEIFRKITWGLNFCFENWNDSGQSDVMIIKNSRLTNKNVVFF